MCAQTTIVVVIIVIIIIVVVVVVIIIITEMNCVSDALPGSCSLPLSSVGRCWWWCVLFRNCFRSWTQLNCTAH